MNEVSFSKDRAEEVDTVTEMNDKVSDILAPGSVAENEAMV